MQVFFTDKGDVKKSEIRIEKDYLKHFKNKCGMAVTIFILMNKLNVFKYPVKVFSDLNHSNSLYSGFHTLSTMLSSVCSKGKVLETKNMQIKILHVLQKLSVQPVISRAKV